LQGIGKGTLEFMSYHFSAGAGPEMKLPMVSIGMPVYNGEKYIAQAIESFLEQEFSDFELIIADNASTDETAQICAEYAQTDHRIRYYRHSHNRGAGPNFNFTFEMARGRYFKWAAHDDFCAPHYLSRCVEVLQRDRQVVLCTTGIVWVDTENRFLRSYDGNLDEADSPRVGRRFRQLSALSHGCFDIFGLIRSEVLARTPRIASFIGSDRALLVELGLYGRIHRIGEELFFSRDHQQRSLRALSLYERGEWWDTLLKGKRFSPWWRLLGEYLQIIGRVPLSPAQRAHCYGLLVPWIRRNWRFLLNDVLYLYQPAHRMLVGKVDNQAASSGS
jgi:glycosyltransferase involved in cell wall biosynthesis